MSPTARSLFFDLLKLVYGTVDAPTWILECARKEKLQEDLIDVIKGSTFFNEHPAVIELLEELEDGHCTCEYCGIKGDNFKLVCSEDLVYLCPACEE